METRNYTINDNLHLKFKIKCIKEKTTMSDELRKFIESYVVESRVTKSHKKKSSEANESEKMNF